MKAVCCDCGGPRSEGAQARCWECYSRTRIRDTKTCPGCGLTGNIDDDFGRRNAGGRANCYCRKCAAARTRANAAANPNRVRTPGDPAKTKARQQRWNEAHREEINARNAERDRLNPLKKAERTRRRRARIRAATVEPVDYAEILAEHGRVCHLCGDPIDGSIDFDHVIPIAKGGAHSRANIRPSHPRCNRSKGASLAYATRQRVVIESNVNAA